MLMKSAGITDNQSVSMLAAAVKDLLVGKADESAESDARLPDASLVKKETYEKLLPQCCVSESDETTLCQFQVGRLQPVMVILVLVGVRIEAMPTDPIERNPVSHVVDVANTAIGKMSTSKTAHSMSEYLVMLHYSRKNRTILTVVGRTVSKKERSLRNPKP